MHTLDLALVLATINYLVDKLYFSYNSFGLAKAVIYHVNLTLKVTLIY